jgi:hypothetical protein
MKRSTRAAVVITSIAGLAAWSSLAQVVSRDAQLAQVLEQCVRSDGTVSFAALTKVRGNLNRYLVHVAETSPMNRPKSFATDAERLAYYINSFHGLLLSGLLELGPATSSTGDAQRKVLKKKFVIGGEDMSLSNYLDKVIRKAGDPRVHFAISRITVGSPRLRPEPYSADDLDSELETAARAFLGSDDHVRVDSAEGIVYVSGILKWYEKDFVGDGENAQLIEYINRYRDEPVPSDLKLKFIDHDWTSLMSD